MTTPQPYGRSGESGLTVQRLSAYSGGGTSPQSATFTLPGYGMYQAVVKSSAPNENNAALVVATIVWFKNDASGGGANNLAKTNLVGTPGYSGIVDGLTVSDPSSSGVVTVTTTWNDASTRTATVTLVLRKLATTADILAAP